MPISASELLAALPRLRRYAHLLTADRRRADALVERTVARVRLQPGELPFGSARHAQWLRLLRQVHAEESTPEGGGAWPTADANRDMPASLFDDDHARDLLTQLFRLPVDRREVIVLVAVERMSYDDVASLLDIPVATVMARLAQAREELRTITSGPVAAPGSAG